MTKKGSFEEGLARLKEIDQALKAEDISLEKSVSLYQEAKLLVDRLHKSLDEAEIKVKNLQGDDVEVRLDDQVD